MPILLQLIVGFACLFLGGELLVRGASRLASLLGIPPLIIGLTVVSFGTSAPELAVCVDAVTSDKSSIAIGNIVGSNISNVLLILGITAAIFPLVVRRQLIRIDVPIMISTSVLFLLLALDGSLSRVEGALLLTLMLGYIALLIWLSRRHIRSQAPNEEAQEPVRTAASEWFANIGWVAVGGVLLAFGGNCLVSGAVGIAERLGVSELVIGLTIVAIGSSLPEIVTAIVAARRGHSDLAVGNVVGSNIANVCLVGGTSALIAVDGISIPLGVTGFDMPVMIAAAVACLPIFARNSRIHHFEGVLFLMYFIAYTAYVLLAAAEHDALRAFNTAMLAFVIPLTTIMFALLCLRAMKSAPL